MQTELMPPKLPSNSKPVEFVIKEEIGPTCYNQEMVDRLDFNDDGKLIVRERRMYIDPISYYTRQSTLEEFILGMLALGKPLETSIVGVFDEDEHGRGSRRDIELPLHRDGEYSQALAEVQGGTYVAKEGIDIVGLYCIQEGTEACYTVLEWPNNFRAEVDLKKGEALVFDNHNLVHGRKGPVGDRLLLRMWIKRKEPLNVEKR